MSWPIKLVCYITVGWKGWLGTNTFYINKPIKLQRKWSVVNTHPGLHSQLFILFVTYEVFHKARVLHYSGLEMLVRDKHSVLLKLFLSYKEK